MVTVAVVVEREEESDCLSVKKEKIIVDGLLSTRAPTLTAMMHGAWVHGPLYLLE
jgi:hypothetical protein